MTFGADSSYLKKVKSPESYLRALRIVDEITRDNLRDARATIRRGKKDLADVDDEAIADVPDPPFIGGSGKLKEAQSLARKERRYLTMGRDFLRRYERLVDFNLELLRILDRASVSFGKGLANIPTNPTTPEAYSGPVDKIASDLEKHMRPLRKVEPPAEVRYWRRDSIDSYAFFARSLRGFARAVRARDLAGFNRRRREFQRGAKRVRALGRSELLRLLERSSYSRQIKKLNHTADALGGAFQHLGASYSGA
jgi:hypothetical protein